MCSRKFKNAAYEYQRSRSIREESVVVGVNRFVVNDEKPIPTQRIDEDLERKQVERLRALRVRRDHATWQSALQQIDEAARSGENLMPRILTTQSKP